MQFQEAWVNQVGMCLVALVSLLKPCDLAGQHDSIHSLLEIEVTGSRIDLTDIGKHTEFLDSQKLASSQNDNLAVMLGRQTPMFIRSYGNGTLATLGIRGGNASHTQLLWNGIPLRNPMIGLVDLALIPSLFVDEAAVHYGGHGAAFGSGAVGGLISLSNQTLFRRNDITLHLSAGSWDRKIGELKVNYGTKNLRFSTRAFSQYALNNYRYKLNKDLPERNQVHHRLRNEGLLQEISFRMSELENITARVWYQKTDRQIPPTSTQTTSKTAQQDESVRVSLQWMRKGEKFSWQLKTAWLDETIDFQDTLILLFTNNHFSTWMAEAETSFRLAPGLSFSGGLYTEVSRGNSANYQSETSRYQHAVFGSLRYLRENWLWRVQAREESTDDTWSPVLIDISAEWSGIKSFTAKASLSRNYRIPTLNDLYWRPGGNPELEPEQGWTMETGIHFNSTSENRIISSSITGYARTINQWIMWMPPIKDIRNYWSPINVAEVYSSGVEARVNFEEIVNVWTFNLNLAVDLTRSVFGTPLPDFTIEKGDQLFYVPVENFLVGTQIKFKQWSGYYQHHWFGDAPGITDEIKAGNVGSAGISYHLNPERIFGKLYLQVDNAWNSPYRIIERRPMPGRSFVAGVRFTFY